MSSMRSSAKPMLADDDLWELTPSAKARIYASLGYTAQQVADELEFDEDGEAFEAWLSELSPKRREEAERDIPTAFNRWALRR